MQIEGAPARRALPSVKALLLPAVSKGQAAGERAQEPRSPLPPTLQRWVGVISPLFPRWGGPHRGHSTDQVTDAKLGEGLSEQKEVPLGHWGPRQQPQKQPSLVPHQQEITPEILLCPPRRPPPPPPSLAPFPTKTPWH